MRSTPARPSWRLRAPGTGCLRDDSLEARVSFELDVRDVGVKPPRFLMLKVDEIVRIEVALVAHAVR